MTSEIRPKSEDGQAQKLVMPTDQSTELMRVSAAHLIGRYGLVLDGAALVEVLRYPSVSAFERSMQRGHLKLKTLKLPNRRGIFVHAQELAQYLARASENEQDELEDSRSESSHTTRIEKGA